VKITGISTLQALSRPTSDRQQIRKSEDARTFADYYEASEAAKNFNTARRAAANTPEVREAKIAELAAQMQAGTYSVSMMDIASKIVDARI